VGLALIPTGYLAHLQFLRYRSPELIKGEGSRLFFGQVRGHPQVIREPIAKFPQYKLIACFGGDDKLPHFHFSSPSAN
jgi:hypothetical protein